MKFFETFLSIKKKWINSLNDRKVVSVNQIERNFLKYFLIATNYENNLNNELNKKRQFYSIIYCLIMGLIAINFLLAAFITDPEIWILMGDAFYLTGERVFFNILFFLISSFIFFVRVSLIFCKYCF
jgi:hypothetical protein